MPSFESSSGLHFPIDVTEIKRCTSAKQCHRMFTIHTANFRRSVAFLPWDKPGPLGMANNHSFRAEDVRGQSPMLVCTGCENVS
eukprot:616379-Rhodomonas_salina.1